MVSLNEETTIASPPAAIWPLLRDPAVVASCIPGADLSADAGDDVWRGTLRVKFGPTVAVFKGEATLAFDDAERRLTIEGRGIDGRGASRALASSVVTLAGGDTTTMTVQGEFNVTGPLETFVNAGGVHVARALLADFSANIAKAAAARGADSQEPGAPPTPAAKGSEAPGPSPAVAETTTAHSGRAPAPSPVDTPAPEPSPRAAPPRPAELGAGNVLWRALVGWIRSLFGKGK